MATKKKAAKRKVTKKAAKRKPVTQFHFLEEELLKEKRKRKASKPESVLVRIRVGGMEESEGMPRETYEKLQALCLGIGEDTMCGLLELGIEAAEAREGNLPPHRDIERHKAVLRKLCHLLLPHYDTHSDFEDAETKAIALLKLARVKLLR